ncbi:histone acetyltransferase type B catalytic subunit-like isoform X1 [Ornithodoros turicata]|uniref:histone acetyltransferase type B catalytic subunit-like isoform X1 n=1 Tax=Ornithodoros turicata TaxID=34597 RepID=UPI0031386C61
MAVVSLSKGALDAYIASGNDVVEFKLVRTAEDLDNDSLGFAPEMSHQIFGEGENIFGYRNLRVKIYYTACSLNIYVSVKYAEKISVKKSDGVKPDDVVGMVTEKLPPGFYSNLDHFSSILSKESQFKPFGVLQHSFTFKKGNPGCRTFEIYKVDTKVPGFVDYHARMQTFILWYIDAASYIDSDDERWEYFVLHEKKIIGGATYYLFAGYATVYRYYAYPANMRPRISQMLILPPFQKHGLGAELLQTIYNYYLKEPSVVDVTVEDPSEAFTRLRDFVDARNCLKLASYSPKKLHKGFSEEMRKEAQEKLKLNKRQARKVYEMLRLHVTNRSNPGQYKMYRLEVKNRLNAPYQRQKADMEKLRHVMSEEEFRTTQQCLNAENRFEQLETQYREVELEYRRVLERLAASNLR